MRPFPLRDGTPGRAAQGPRARWPLLLAIAVAVAAAGCLGGPPGDQGPGGNGGSGTGPSSSSTGPAPPPPGPPVVDLLLGFALEECRGVSVRQPVPLDAVQALLPPGFAARVMEGTEGLPDGGYGQAVVDLYACGNLTASAARVPSTFYGQVHVPIEPPVGRVPGAPQAAHSEYVLRVLAGQDVLANLWPAAGYDTRGGAASLEVAGPPGPLDLGARTAQGAVGDLYLLEASAARVQASSAAAAPVVGDFARYTALADGSVLVWTGRYEFPGGLGGHGTFDVPADDPFASFEAPGTGRAGALAVVHEGGAMAAMDLRRVFTPP